MPYELNCSIKDVNGYSIDATVVTLVGVYVASLVANGFTYLLLSKEIAALKQNPALLSYISDLIKNISSLLAIGIYMIIIKVIVTVIVVYLCVCFIFKIAQKEDKKILAVAVKQKLKK